MEWVIVLGVAAVFFWWSWQKGAFEGRVWRLLSRLIPHPNFDTKLLPRALATGVGFAVVGAGLQLTGHEGMEMAFGLVIGPFLGGLVVRSRWWVFVASISAITLESGIAIRAPIIALPAALIAFAGTQIDWRSRLGLHDNAAPQSAADQTPRS
jgi:hypothetical protein